MKYGRHFEEQSVPEWSLHNIDYNSLKHQIKAHTTKSQATAIAIPGQQDFALKRFEDGFYLELCRQHDRVNLFVLSKADEIHRRLRHLLGLVNRLILQCADTRGLTVKRQRRFAKYRYQIDECGDDIKAMGRFVNAQVVAFRKILKKYKKWTGSTTLSSRFNENILSSPKSFTRRDFHPLQMQYEEVLTTLQAASPGNASPQLHPAPSRDSPTDSPSPRGSRRSSRTPGTVSISAAPPTVYWNEYDNGSEQGDYGEDTYAIYIDPNQTADIPGFAYIKTIVSEPVDRVCRWLKSRTSSSPEARSLLNHSNAPVDYFSVHPSDTASHTDAEATETTEDGYTSSEEGRYSHGAQYAAFPEVEEQKMALYHDKILNRAVVFAYATAFVLLVISGMLIVTGRHKLRLEVDAGVTIGCVTSLFCGCMGLGAMFARHYTAGWMYTLMVWAAFIAVCVLNGMLLVLVVGSNGL